MRYNKQGHIKSLDCSNNLLLQKTYNYIQFHMFSKLLVLTIFTGLRIAQMEYIKWHIFIYVNSQLLSMKKTLQIVIVANHETHVGIFYVETLK